jgi:hypothetical protein
MTKRKTLPPSLKKLDDLSDSKNAIKNLSKSDMKLYITYQKQLRRDTDDRLTQTEYEQFSLISVFLNHYWAWEQREGVENIPPAYVDMARKYRYMLTEAMKMARKEAPRGKSLLDGAREFIMQMEKDDGEELKIEWKKKPKEEKELLDVLMDEKNQS